MGKWTFASVFCSFDERRYYFIKLCWLFTAESFERKTQPLRLIRFSAMWAASGGGRTLTLGAQIDDAEFAGGCSKNFRICGSSDDEKKFVRFVLVHRPAQLGFEWGGRNLNLLFPAYLEPFPRKPQSSTVGITTLRLPDSRPCEHPAVRRKPKFSEIKNVRTMDLWVVAQWNQTRNGSSEEKFVRKTLAEYCW